jgi:DNA ligase-1
VKQRKAMSKASKSEAALSGIQQRSIASFFSKKAAPQAAQGTSEPAKDADAGSTMQVDVASTPPQPTPVIQSASKKLEADTPPTNTRKRLKQAESSDSEDDRPAAPKQSGGAGEEDSAEEAVKVKSKPGGDEQKGSPGQQKKQRQESPMKQKDGTSVASFFTKKATTAPAAEKAAGAAVAIETKEAPVSNQREAPAPGQSDGVQKAAKEEGPKTEDAKKPLTNMEKRKAEDKKLREQAKQEKANSVHKGALGGGWGGSAVQKEDAGNESPCDDDGAMDDIDEEAKQELVKSTLSFDATKEATWKKGEPVPYSHLANMFEKVEETTKRLEITAIVTKALRAVIEVTPQDLLPCVFLIVNKLAPAHEGIELGIGESILTKALAEATGRQTKDIKLDLQQLGDLGKVANKARALQRTMFAAKSLTVRGVHTSLLQIAKMSGTKSGDQKKEKIKSLLVAAKGVEAQYLFRHLQGKMRTGLGEQSVLVALAHAAVQSKGGRTKDELDQGDKILKEVFVQLPCFDRIIPELLENPITELSEKCFLQPGIPVKPMLAHPTKGIREVLDRFDGKDFTCEYKYDGERAQIHLLKDGSIKIYSRNSEDNTSKYPDLIRMIPSVIAAGTESFVIDSEVVAYDLETKKILPFQVLSTRKRKDASEDTITVQVCLFAFDILFLNGQSLLKEPLAARREKLHASFKVTEGTFQFATSKDASDTEEILAFLNESIKDSCEGLMVKTLTDKASTYEPAQRSHKWLKVKKDYIDGMTDTLDLVPIGAFYGKGKRTGVYGAYLLACYNEDTEDFECICKIGTGFSEQQLKEFHEFYKDHVIDEPKSYYQYDETPGVLPHVWLDAKQVCVPRVHGCARGHVTIM